MTNPLDKMTHPLDKIIKPLTIMTKPLDKMTKPLDRMLHRDPSYFLLSVLFVRGMKVMHGNI